MSHFNEWEPRHDDPFGPLIWLFAFLLILILLMFVPVGAHAADFDVMELTCGVGVSPNECSPHYGAVDVAKIGEASLPLECLRWGLLSAPSSPNKADGNAYYHKIMCVRR